MTNYQIRVISITFTIVIAFIVFDFAITSSAYNRMANRISMLEAQVEDIENNHAELKADYLYAKAEMLGKQARIQTVLASMYSPEESQTDSTPFQTASLKRVRGDYIAVSRDLFAVGWTFGKKVYVPGHGMKQIEDLMGKYKWQHGKWVEITNSIDLFSFDHSEAYSFTPYTTEAYLLD